MYTIKTDNKNFKKILQFESLGSMVIQTTIPGLIPGGEEIQHGLSEDKQQASYVIKDVWIHQVKDL